MQCNQSLHPCRHACQIAAYHSSAFEELCQHSSQFCTIIEDVVAVEPLLIMVGFHLCPNLLTLMQRTPLMEPMQASYSMLCGLLQVYSRHYPLTMFWD